jgi:hypothetical protein
VAKDPIGPVLALAVFDRESDGGISRGNTKEKESKSVRVIPHHLLKGKRIILIVFLKSHYNQD